MINDMDVMDISALDRACFESGMPEPDRSIFYNGMPSKIWEPGSIGYKMSGIMIGYALLKVFKALKTVEIARFGVRQDYRCRSIASDMIQRVVEEYGSRKDFFTITSLVPENNEPAIRIFKSLSFKSRLVSDIEDGKDGVLFWTRV